MLGNRVQIRAINLDFAAIFYMIVGLGLGMLLALSGALLQVFAASSTSIIKDSDTHFSQGTLADTTVVGTGNSAYVQLGGGGTSWYDFDWGKRKQITFSTTGISSDLTNFPVLIKLSASNFDFSQAQSAGQDIRFTDTNGTTALDYEIESWDSVGQTANIWVKVPQLDGGVTTDTIYMYYDNDAATDGQNAPNVWSNGFVAVYHLKETGTTPDVTQYDNSASASTTLNGIRIYAPDPDSTTSGRVGNALHFDGIENAGVWVSQTQGSLIGNGSASFTQEAHIYIEDEQPSYFNYGSVMGGQALVGGCNAREGIYVEFRSGSEREILYSLPFHSGSGVCAGASTVSIQEGAPKDQWQHVVATYDSADKGITTFFNGAQVSTATWGGNGTINWNTDFKIGATGGNNDFGERPFPGIIDEMRISNVERTPDWIKMTYNTMNTDYTTFSAEQESFAPTGTWQSPIDGNVIDLVWNGGWGDGTNGSTAFSATVANVGVNSNITFQMRVANSLEALSGASYVSLGTANSGTTFQKTKSELDALSLGTGGNRYVQILATLNSLDQVTNPRLDNFTLFYLEDVDAPEVAVTNLKLFRTNGGTEVSAGGWTNDFAPHFTWTAATDSESGLYGYCAYLGQDNTADPATTKGLLGTSPASLTGTTCQFIVTADQLDFANTALRGVTWLTNDNDSYYLRLKPIDVALNIAGTATSFEFKFDNVDPINPEYISLPAGFIGTKNANITWPTAGGDEATDADSGVAGLQYRIGASGTWYGDTHTGTEDVTDLLVNDGQYTTDVTVDYPDIQEGTNIIYMRTWDNAGNVTDSYITGALRVNTVAPSAPTNLEVTPTNNTTNSYAFDWDPPVSYTGDVAKITYCYSINVLPSISTCNFTAQGVTELVADAFATQPGANTFYVVARDEAANINYEVFKDIQFTYSGTAPGIPLNLDISDISIKESQRWRLVASWDRPTSLGAGIEYYQILRSTTNVSCSVNPGAFSQVATTVGTSYTDDNLQQQNYYYCIKACDSANSCSAASHTRTGFPNGRFDTPAELQTPPVVTNITTTRATISWTTVRNSDSRVSFGTASNTFFPEEPSRPEQTTSHVVTLSNLLPGRTYFYKAKWVDVDGNVGVSDERVFRTAPAPVISQVTVGNIGVDKATLRYFAEGARAARVYYGVTTGFGAIVEAGTGEGRNPYLTQLPNLQEGTKYYYRINPVDVEGNEYTGTVLEFTTLPRPKALNIEINELRGESQPAFNIKWRTNTDSTTIIRYYPEGQQDAALESAEADFQTGERTKVLRGLIPTTVYTIELITRDRFGNEGKSDTYRVVTADDTRPPRVSNLRVEGSVIAPGVGGEELPTAQLIVAWDTDEPATSQVEYAAGTNVAYDQRTFKDNKLTYNHVIVIPKLEPSKVYSLRVISIDAAGNETRSGDTVTITPKAGETAIEIVLKNLSDIFGFL